MKNKELQKLLKSKIAGAYYMPFSFETSNGCIIKDIEGNEYIDLSSGYGVTNIGWQNKEMVDFQIKSIKKSNYAPPWMPTIESYELANKLTSFFSQEKYKCFRTTGGANGNEVAISVFYNINHGNVATFERAYHGWSQATLGMGEIQKYKMPLVKGEFISKKIPFKEMFSLDYVRDFFKKNDDIKIFIAEPILGSGGIIIPDKKYWKDFFNVCKENNIFLIMDECITGFGRTGKMFASQYYDINPDGIILGKSISSGYAAIGAVLIKEKYLEDYNFGDVSATFAWTPFACSVVLKNIEIIENNLLADRAITIGEKFKIKLNNILIGRNIPSFQIRVIGAMIGLQFFKEDNSPDIYLHGKLLYEFAKNNLIVCTSGDNDTLIFLPPLILEDQALNEAMVKIEKIFKKKFSY